MCRLNGSYCENEKSQGGPIRIWSGGWGVAKFGVGG